MSRNPTHTNGLHTPSLRRRVTLVVLVLLAAMLALLGVTTDLVLQNRLTAQLEQRLVDRAELGVDLGSQLEPSDLAKRLEGNGISVLLVTSSGQAYVEGPPPPGAKAAPGTPKAPKAATDTSTDASAVSRDGDTLQVTREVGNGATLLLSADAGDVRRTVDQVRIALLAGALAVLVVAGLVLGPVIGGALRPLDQITALARTIRRGGRGSRLRPDRPRTELGTTAQAFDEMLDAVEGAEGQALDAERRLREFLSDAAHELRTPIAGLQAAGEHLLRANPDRDERERVLMTLVRESRRAGRLVDDMLLMARIDGGLEIAQVRTDLLTVVEAAVEARRLRHPDARLVVVGSPAPVDIDPDRIGQVVGNLLDNALRATGSRGSIRVVVDTDSGSAVVEVLDDGPGIEPIDRERVFERLVRLGGSTDSGAGLGLPIARGLAQAHGGELVALDPRAGMRGARFCLTLPLPQVARGTSESSGSLEATRAQDRDSARA